jgi:hypothetical protein
MVGVDRARTELNETSDISAKLSVRVQHSNYLPRVLSVQYTCTVVCCLQTNKSELVFE